MQQSLYTINIREQNIPRNFRSKVHKVLKAPVNHWSTRTGVKERMSWGIIIMSFKYMNPNWKTFNFCQAWPCLIWQLPNQANLSIFHTGKNRFLPLWTWLTVRFSLLKEQEDNPTRKGDISSCRILPINQLLGEFWSWPETRRRPLTSNILYLRLTAFNLPILVLDNWSICPYII